MSITPLRSLCHTPRHTLPFPSSSFLLTQRRHARVHDIRFVTTHPPSATILEKYKSKLEEKAEQEGLGSVSELKEAYKQKIQDVRRAAAAPPAGAGAGASLQGQNGAVASSKQALQQPPPPVPQPQITQQTSKSPAAGSGSGRGTGIKPLSSYLDLSKVKTLPVKEIEYIWRLRFASDPLSLCAVVPLDTYHRIHSTARRHPQFILPLPRPAADDGSGDIKTAASGFEGGERTAADVHFLQWGFHPPASAPAADEKTSNTHTSTVIFTHLAAFKLHGEHAQPHTTITHHLDLADSHGIVLLSGAVTDGRGVSTEEGRWLLMCLQKFYDFEGHGGGIGREKRQGLLEKFSKGDTGFSLEELVDEAERIS